MKLSGIDLWTTNTVAAITSDNQEAWITVLDLWDNRKPTRTVLFEHEKLDSALFWDQWFGEYIKRRSWRLLESPKSFLNTEDEIETRFDGKWRKLSEVLGQFLRYVKESVDAQAWEDVGTVILWRPVHFHDTDEKLDKMAQERLEKAAKIAGFSTIHFELEPVAAAMSYDSSQLKENDLALVVDLWGGTSDFSLLRKKWNGEFEVLGNDGIYIGGNNFDTSLSNTFFADHFGKWLNYKDAADREHVIPAHYFLRLWEWDTIHALADARDREHFNQILNGLDGEGKIRFWRLVQVRKDWKGFDYHRMIEEAKIWLSSADEFAWESGFLKDNFSYRVGRVLFEESVRQLGTAIQRKLQETAQLGWRKASDVQKVLITWGTGQIPIIRQLIWKEVGWEDKLVNLDPFAAVGKGLALSWRKFL